MEQKRQPTNKLKTFLHSPLRYTVQSVFNIIYGVIKQLLTFGIIFLFLASTLILGIGMGFFANIISHTEVPSLATLQASIGKLNEPSSLYYGNGTLISEVKSDLTRKIVTFDQISDYVKNGIIATEDSSFYQHAGIVPKAVLRATLQELVGSSNQSGGSTLTQQLIKQQLLTNEFTFSRKAKELLLALRVEKFFDKKDILTAYLNISPFGRNSDGQNIAGIEAAAEGVFGKSAKDLTLPQAAFLVGLPQSPYVYTPYLNTGVKKDPEYLDYGVKRMHIVLNAMKRDGYISEQEFEEAMAYDITADFIAPTNTKKPTQSYIYQAVHNEAVKILMRQQAEKDGKTWDDINQSVDIYNDYYFKAANHLSSAGYKVYSTIDPDIYNAMQTASSQHIDSLGPTYKTTVRDAKTGTQEVVDEPVQTGSVAIENTTGKVLGFIGGRNFDIAQIDHAFSTRRSPGSTIKPLTTYAPAIDNDIIYPASVLADTQISRLQPDGTYWRPTNADGTVSGGFLSAREALKQSLNSPTIHLYSALLAKGIQPGEYMEKMGITAIDKNEYLNEAAAIGGFSTGPTVAEQTSAFTTFSNDGEHIPYYVIEKIEDASGNVIYEHKSEKTRVFSEDTAFLIRSMLMDSVNSGTTQYFRQYVNFALPEIFGKTGTTDNFKDLWVIISTPSITIGQWAGWDNNRNVEHVFIDNDAYGYTSVRTQRYWANIANAINAVKPEYFSTSQKFNKPDTIIRTSVLAATGTLPGSLTSESGTPLSVSGEFVTDYFSKSRPPFALSYAFSPGASAQELEDFWAGRNREKEEKEKKEKEEKEKKEKEEKEKKEKEEKEKDGKKDDETTLNDLTSKLDSYSFTRRYRYTETSR